MLGKNSNARTRFAIKLLIAGILLGTSISWSQETTLPQCTSMWFPRGDCVGTEEIRAIGNKEIIEERYVGEFRNGNRHGRGTLVFRDGDKYVGQFSGGSFFDQGTFNGQGTYTFADGRRKEGEYLNGELHGKGTIYDASGRIIAKGYFEKGVLIKEDDPEQGKSRPLQTTENQIGGEAKVQKNDQTMGAAKEKQNNIQNDNNDSETRTSSSPYPKYETEISYNANGDMLVDFRSLNPIKPRRVIPLEVNTLAPIVGSGQSGGEIAEPNRKQNDRSFLTFALGRKWSIGKIPCELNGGSYQVFDRERGWIFFSNGKGTINKVRTTVEYTDLGESKFAIKQLYFSNDLIEKSLKKRDVIQRIHEWTFEKVSSNIMRIYKVNTDLDFDLMLNGIQKYIPQRQSPSEVRLCE